MEYTDGRVTKYKCKLSNIEQGVTRDVTVDSTDVKKSEQVLGSGNTFPGIDIRIMGWEILELALIRESYDCISENRTGLS